MIISTDIVFGILAIVFIVLIFGDTVVGDINKRNQHKVSTTRIVKVYITLRTQENYFQVQYKNAWGKWVDFDNCFCRSYKHAKEILDSKRSERIIIEPINKDYE